MIQISPNLGRIPPCATSDLRRPLGATSLWRPMSWSWTKVGSAGMRDFTILIVLGGCRPRSRRSQCRVRNQGQTQIGICYVGVGGEAPAPTSGGLPAHFRAIRTAPASTKRNSRGPVGSTSAWRIVAPIACSSKLPPTNPASAGTAPILPQSCS